MEFPIEPEEPTSVIRIMENFAKFTNDGRSRRQLNRSRSGRTFGSDSFVSDSQNITNKSALESERDRKKDIEVLTTKARLVDLEKQLKNIETDRKRGIIELESDGVQKQRKITKLGEEKEDLQRELKYILEKEESAREEAECLQKKLDKLQKQYRSEVDTLKKANTKYARDIDELKESHRKEVNELVTRVNQTDVIFYKNKAEENGAQLELLKSKLSKYLYVIKENEELAAKLRDAEYKSRAAEEKAARQEEAFVIAKVMQEKVVAFDDMQKEIEKYKEENKLLKDTRDNVVLLTNKYETIKAKYDVAVEKIHSLIALETENEELKKKLKKWEVEDISSGAVKARSPLELTRMISDLQKSQLSMVEKQADLQASASIKDSSFQKLKEKFDELKQQYAQLEEKEKQQADKYQRLQRRFLLVTAERDSTRRILNNFDSGMSSVQSNQLRARVEEAENHLGAANEVINTMENENDALRKEISTYRLLSTKLQTELSDLKAQNSVKEEDTSNTDKLKREIDELTKENSKLQEKVDVLEARIEQRHLQGDFDPTKTKVLHFAGNPLALSRKLHAQEMDKLRDENEDLRRRIKALEQHGSESSVVQTLPSGIESGNDEQMQELKSRLESSELQNKRLKEVFTNTVQEFRESCYQLFGYKNDMIGPSKFKLLSMYAERPDDHFIFQMTPEHQLEMIDTDFSHQFKDIMDIYLHRGASIPAFLSSVTLDLFSRQTQIVNSSLFKV